LSRRLTDLQALHALAIEVAPVIIGPGAAGTIDQRAARAAWLATLSHLDMTEAQARDHLHPQPETPR
jgi:hypothetical protein